MIREKSTIEKRYLVQFNDLLYKLSPENLNCDGELSYTEAKKSYDKLIKIWKRLEKKVGRTVS